jgi:hypothetical protein
MLVSAPRPVGIPRLEGESDDAYQRRKNGVYYKKFTEKLKATLDEPSYQQYRDGRNLASRKSREKKIANDAKESTKAARDKAVSTHSQTHGQQAEVSASTQGSAPYEEVDTTLRL